MFVSTAQSAFKTCALSGTVVFGRRAELTRDPIALGRPVSIDAKADLYGRQFFVGPLYRRMGAIHSVDPKQSVCIGEIHAQPEVAREAFSNALRAGSLVLGDQYFRDTLLHTSLLHHLDHMAFTSRIDRIELLTVASQHKPAASVCRVCCGHRARTEYELVAVSTEGRVLEVGPAARRRSPA